MESKNRLRALRGASALVATALLALGFAGAASAADTSTINPDATGSLTIHKYEQPTTPLNINHDGTEQTIPSSVKPLSGVTFKIEQVDPTTYNLGTNAGWQALSNLDVAKAQAAPKGAAIAPQSTSDNGEASFTGLPIGVYLVTETNFPAGTTPAAPFLVTVPITDPVRLDNWLYNVHVYPKNSTTNMPTKTVDEAASVAVGQNVTWTIQGDVSRVNQDPTGSDIPFTGYRVTDQLDSKLSYKSSTVSIVTPKNVADPNSGFNTVSTFNLGADYTIDDAALASNKVQITLTETGLGKLAAAKKADDNIKVQVDIVTEVAAVGDIHNTALVFPNAASFDQKQGDPNQPLQSNDTDTKWGNVTIEKVDATNNATPVPGAQFQVFRSQADAKALNNPIDVNGTSTWTTGSDGKLTISGLRYSTYFDGATVAVGDPGYQEYWIAETKAAGGYSLLAQPVRVIVNDEDNVVDYKLTADAKHNGGFALPFTGSALSASVFYGGGAAVLLAIIVTVVARSRRKDHAQA